MQKEKNKVKMPWSVQSSKIDSNRQRSGYGFIMKASQGKALARRVNAP
jgi:hypothetical protein